MINKYEAVGIFASVSFMAIALFLLRVDGVPTFSESSQDTPQQALVIAVVDKSTANQQNALYRTLTEASQNGSLDTLVVNDVVLGSGEEAVAGSIVTVDYIGTLETGEQFDNSKKRGQPFTFTLGENRVIQGWEQGILGMKIGGERILVIPPEMAYGNKSVGPIPANATLVFAVSLLNIE